MPNAEQYFTEFGNDVNFEGFTNIQGAAVHAACNLSVGALQNVTIQLAQGHSQSARDIKDHFLSFSSLHYLTVRAASLHLNVTSTITGHRPQ